MTTAITVTRVMLVVFAAALTGAIRVAATAGDEQPHHRTELAERVFDLLASGLSSYGAAPDDNG